MGSTAGRSQHSKPVRSFMHTLVAASALLWCAATVGVRAQDAPDYPTFAAALQDNKNNLTEMYILLASPTLVNASAFLNDPTNNAILLGITNADFDFAFTEFPDSKFLVTDSLRVTGLFQYLVIPQPPGTKNAVLGLTDGTTLNTSLSSTTLFGNSTEPTVNTLTFRDEGDGKWYVGGIPPGFQLDTRKTFTCGAGRLYIVDDGVPAPPTKLFTTSSLVAKILTVVEALQPNNIPKSLSTFATLALADPTIKAMFSSPDLTITIFAPSNQAWSDFLSSNGTTVDKFKGTKEAQRVLLGCMAVQRPYMVSQFPAGFTEVTDSLNRPFHLVAPDGPMTDNSTSVKLVSAVSSVFILPAPLRNLRGGKSIIHGIDGVLIPDPAIDTKHLPGSTDAGASDYPTFAAALQDPKNSLTSLYVLASSPSLINASAVLNDPNNNAIILAVTNADIQFAFSEFSDSQMLVSNSLLARAFFNFLVIPQPVGSRNAELQLTDGITLNTSLTISPEYAQANTQTLSTITFRDLGQGRWYIGGTPPGAEISLNNTFTCGAGRMYIVDNGFPAPPSKFIATSQSVDTLLSVTEALQPVNIPKNLTTFSELAMADSTIKSMFSDPDLAITVFAPSNQAWSDYLASQNTTMAAFKGSKQAQHILLGCMAVQRPYMISQFPQDLTPVTDSLNRTYQLTSLGTPSDSSQAKLVFNTSSVLILPAPARNLRGGKSIIHGINGVLVLDPVAANTTNITTGLPAPFNTSTDIALTDASGGNSDSSSKKSVGFIVGLVVGGTAAVALLALTVSYIVKQHAASSEQSEGDYARKGSMPKDAAMAGGEGAADRNPLSPVPGSHMDLPGVHRGIFTRMVAHEFQWTDYVPIPGETVSVEAGITDTQLDQMLGREGAGVGAEECPVVKLTKEEVKEQLVLLRQGVIGKGATAMVFQCLWPRRFGPNALLAAKVLKEGSDADPQHLQSFAYEASVLSSLLHANVVRLYGYCLEPPTVVLILELLPTSLKRMLYDADPCATRLSTTSNIDGVRQQSGQSGKPRTPTPPSTRLASDVAQYAVHRNDSYLHDSSQQNQTGVYSPSSAPSTTGLSGSQAHPAVQLAKAFGSPSTVVSDADVTVTMQPIKAAVRKLTVREVLTISADIAAGLAFMHDRANVEVQPASQFEAATPGRNLTTKVVHRDLKPANILMNSKGRAKISDFGLARQHQQTTIGTAHLGAGTLPYMAPELLMHAAAGPFAHATATNRVDIYSLAMIIWEQLAGQTPWQGSADASLVIAVTQGRRPPLPEPPTEERPLYPELLEQPANLEVLPQLNAVVRACWRQRELKRPTATAVLYELNNLLTKLGAPPIEMPMSPDHVALNMYPELSGAPSAVALSTDSNII